MTDSEADSAAELLRRVECVARARMLSEQAARVLDREVRATRALGATWTQLAAALGVSPQAVSKRYREGTADE